MLASVASPSAAVTLQPMTVAYSGIVSGNLSTAGNSVLTCSTDSGENADSCIAARSRSATKLNNDDYKMINIKVPFASLDQSQYFNASSSSIIVPAGASIVHATLFWSGSMRMNPGDRPAVAPKSKGRVLFARPGDNCATINCTVDAVDSDVYQINADTDLGQYRASADITKKLNQSGLPWVIYGPNQSLTLSAANIQTTLGVDKAAGWGVIVVYQDAKSTPHQIRILKGMAQESIIKDDAFSFDGLKTADTGNVLSEIAIVSFDGDASSASDSLAAIDRHGSVVVADKVNPDNNIANSTISIEGAINPYLNNSQLGRSTNTFGVDVDRISMVNGLSKNIRSAKLQPSVSSDVFYLTGIALSVEVASPDIQLTKFVSLLDGDSSGIVESGDTARYTIVARNIGQTHARKLVIRDDLGDDLNLASSTGSDCAQVPRGDICKDIGTLRAGESISIGFNATVTGASELTTGSFDNFATATFNGPLGPQTSKSQVVTLDYGSMGIDLASQVSFAKDFIQAGKSTTVTASVTNLGPSSDINPSVKLVAQDGANLIASKVPTGCIKEATNTLLCNASALGVSITKPLEPGATASVSMRVTPKLTSSSFKVWATAITGHSEPDSNLTNNNSETFLYVNHKPKAKIAKANVVANGKPVQINLASKISDIDGDALQIELGQVEHGNAKVSGGIVTYTPPKQWTGTFKIRYSVTDGKGGTDKSWIIIKVSKSGISSGSNGSNGVKYCLKSGC
jgi:uncharacterized repeat protein (TIGR01451 family)